MKSFSDRGFTKSESIEKYTSSINDLMRDERQDKFIGRERELNEIITVLARKNKNNVILVGNSGVGKTALVRGLAKMINEKRVPDFLENKEILLLNVIALISGTSLRGMFEERINNLFNELKESGRYILFIDDIHNVLKSGNKEKDTDMTSMLNGLLSDGKVRIIATTTFKDYRSSIESNQAIAQRLQKVVIDPSSTKETYEILNSLKQGYELFHQVSYTDEAIRKCISYAERYIHERNLPDSAIDIMDTAGAGKALINDDSEEVKNATIRLIEVQDEKENALNHGEFERIDELNQVESELKIYIADERRKKPTAFKVVSDDDIANTVADMLKVPASKLTAGDKERLRNIDNVLKESVIGQDEAIDAICRVIKRNKMGLGDRNKPLGTMLLMGQSGVGKTLLAKKLAQEVFGDEKYMVRVDMSEYSEKNSVSKLVGSAPGYVGFENGGQLTEAVKHKQHCVLLLDEIEKADQEVYNIFLQLFDEGRLTDSAGQMVNFKNVIVLMTSNVGARKAEEMGAGIGFSKNESENKKSVIQAELKKTFTPEFLNRIDKIVYFNSLTDDNMRDIVKLEINKFKNRLSELEYKFVYTDEVVEHIRVEASKSKGFGARPIIRLVQENIEDKVTDLLIEREYEREYTFSALCESNSITVM